jgi:hypothetical protein
MNTYAPTFDAVSGWGVGREGRGVVVKDVAGDLFTGEKGAMAETTTSANLGSELLKRFAVTFDYANRTMYLEPAPTPLPRDIYDRATAGGPAAKAGLAARRSLEVAGRGQVTITLAELLP